MEDMEIHRAALDAECSVLGSILIDARCLADLIPLAPADFSTDANREIFKAIISLQDAHAAIDPVTVLDAMHNAGTDFAGCRDYVLQLMEITPTAVNARRYSKSVRREALRRQAAAISMDISNPLHAADLLTNTQRLSDITDMLCALDAEDTRSNEQLFDDFIAAIQTDTFKPFASGMPDFDGILSGGIRPQELVILGGAPGIGKTAFTQQLFETMAQNGIDVIYFNLEMSREQLLARSLARMISKDGGKVSALEILQGYNWTTEQGKTIEAAARRYRREIAPHIVYNPMQNRSATLASILAAMTNAAERATKAGTAAPAVVVDYLQLVECDDRMEQSEIIKRAVKAFKDYAIKYNTFVFVIMANNRASNASGKATQESGRDTSAIEYSADTMLQLAYTASLRRKDALTPDEILSEEDPAERLRLKSEVTLRVVKKRSGEPGHTLPLYFDGASSRFYPIDSKHDDFVELRGYDPKLPFI